MQRESHMLSLQCRLGDEAKKQPGAKFNFGQLMNKAAAIYADLKREESKPGWWMELADGRWVQK